MHHWARRIAPPAACLLAGLLTACGGSSGSSGGLAAGTTAATSSGSTAGASSGSTAGASSGSTAATTSWVPAGTQVRPGPLFDIPPGYLANGGDPVFVPARFESDVFTDRNPNDVPATLTAVAWNVHRGEDALAVIDEFRTNPVLQAADFVLLQECPRDDSLSIPAGINLARELAQVLLMDYVYAAEWDFRDSRANGGEQGNAILSKYPLGNVEQLRHRAALDYRLLFGRYGGWMTLRADAWVGGRLVRLYATHLEVSDLGGGRAAQMAGVRADADQPGHPTAQVIGGDFNSFMSHYLLPGPPEPSIVDLLNDGWRDGMPGVNEYTHLGAGFFPQKLDWFFYRGVQHAGGAGVEQGAHGSDHFPIFFELSVR